MNSVCLVGDERTGRVHPFWVAEGLWASILRDGQVERTKMATESVNMLTFRAFENFRAPSLRERLDFWRRSRAMLSAVFKRDLEEAL